MNIPPNYKCGKPSENCSFIRDVGVGRSTQINLTMDKKIYKNLLDEWNVL